MAIKRKTTQDLTNKDKDLIKVCVLGDSMSAHNYAWNPSWPSRLEQVLRHNGVNCEVRTFATNAHTFNKINTLATYDGKTALLKCREYKPDIILVVCGVNDLIDSAEERTLAEVKEDADYTFRFLRNALPNAEIYYVDQQPYDTDNFTGSTLKNKGCPPKLMTLKSTGVFADTVAPAIIEDDLDSDRRDEFDNYDLFNTYIKTNPDINGSFGIRAWLIARLGLLNPDRYHFNSAGDALKCCAVITGLQEVNAKCVATLGAQLVSGWNDIDSILTDFLSPSGDGYTAQWPPSDEGACTWSSLGKNFAIDSWYHEYKAQSDFYPLALTNTTTLTGQYHWHVHGAKPHTSVENAILLHSNGSTIADFTATGFSTDEVGNCYVSGLIGGLLPNGSYDYYLKVGIDVFGPWNIVLS